MKKTKKTFTKGAVKQLAGAQLTAAQGGLAGYDPIKKKEIVGG